ncbi:hypothetical protein GMLC_29200 [Geomonas limicola]|uniref:Uncharacterized protein n=1 Tax=Geomonas limicola TaxID=2740186 RepID=A0A6V8NA28_9BACT|nr:hypothetical protein [Geomonas limicola]GFO69341.1 hypothetical protein GMLC_29200 [Geomonas limicola]
METQKPQRLCSEIQLFDLCDLDTCCQKDGRYCTNPEVLERFEAIKEEDERSPQQYLGEEFDDEEEGEDEDSFDEDSYEDDDM